MSGSLVTIFGGSGFLGRYVTERFARQGCRIRIAVRHPHQALFLQPLGEVGQIDFVAANVRHQGSVMAAVRGAETVVNLVGILRQSGKQRFDAVQAHGAGLIARAARGAGAKRLVHVSAIGADPASPSAYGRSKAEGERLVRAAFPDAAILRPSLLFGAEDDFFNRFARLARLLPVMPLVCGDSRFQPVYVGDVADGIAAAASRPDAMGRLYELGGPRVASFRELLLAIMKEIGVRRPLLALPLPLARLNAAFLGLLPHPPITLDQLRMLEQDTIVSDGADGLSALGIQPTPMEAILPAYLARYRVGGQFAR